MHVFLKQRGYLYIHKKKNVEKALNITPFSNPIITDLKKKGLGYQKGFYKRPAPDVLP